MPNDDAIDHAAQATLGHDASVSDPLLPVVILAYDGVAADEAGVIAEILTGAGIEIVVAAVQTTAVTSFHGSVSSTRPVAGFGPCAALVIPGGMGVKTAARDSRLTDAIAELAERSTWLGATSTGSILLAAAGLATGARATTHWLARELMEDRGMVCVDEPFVEHGRLLTASGLGSSAMLGFRLVAALRGTDAEKQARARYRPSARPAPSSRSRRRHLFGRRPTLRRGAIGWHRIDETEAPSFAELADEVILLDLDRR
jgi:transcriptional regulator GlxA family with amidase domain